MIKNTYKGYKTTILGVILISGGLGHVFHNTTPDYIIMCVLIGVGICLLFTPDTVINFLSKKSKEL